MGIRHIAVVAVAAVTSGAPLVTPMPIASAQPCPDVEVVFARGTTEAPGLGPTGQTFVDSLRSRVGPRSMSVYAVDYPASTDFHTALDGIRDASGHIRSTAASCPNTQMVLGGFSQGAAVMGFVTANVIPDGAPEGVPNPMPIDIANHVAAVALFGKPNDRFMHAINEPSIAIGPLYAAKTIDLCVPDDLICSSGTDFNAHTQYAETGLVEQAAAFAASRLPAAPPPSAPAPTPAAPAPTPAPAAPAPTQAPAAPAPTQAPAAPSPAPAPPPSDGPVPQHPGLAPGTLLLCKTTCSVVSPT